MDDLVIQITQMLQWKNECKLFSNSKNFSISENTESNKKIELAMKMVLLINWTRINEQ